MDPATQRPRVATDVASLRRGFDGQVLLPGEDGYDQARQVWNATVDLRPAVIARCASAADVAAVVRFATARGLELGVRGGGHSVLGVSVPESGLMLDLSPMGAVRVDPDKRRAWVQGGALLGALDRAAQQFGLATTAGNVSHTGVGGLTLGGGMGWLARRFGLACDNVTRFELVTADGELVHVSASEEPELFWGLRGGGGNFGVVTEFEFALHPVGTAAMIVDLVYALDEAPDVLVVADASLRLRPGVGDGGDHPPGEQQRRRGGAGQAGCRRTLARDPHVAAAHDVRRAPPLARRHVHRPARRRDPHRRRDR